MTPAPTKKYSYSWSLTVVWNLEQSYARVMLTVYRILDIDARILAKYLAIGDPLFAQLRRMVHIMDNWEKRQDMFEWDYTHVKSLGLQMRSMGYERLEKRIDKYLNRNNNRRAGVKGGLESGLPTTN